MKPKLGILLCDKVSTRYSPPHRDYPQKFMDLLPRFEHHHFRAYAGELPGDLSVCDAWLATGSRNSVYEDRPWITSVLDLIREIHDANRVYVGVCFGHQLLGHALGGQVAKGKSGWNVGVHEFSMLQTAEWMQPTRSHVRVLMMCQDQILIPPVDTSILASSEACPIAMFTVGANMLGIQGHPEFSPAFERSLLEDRRALIGKEKVEAALESLERPVDREVLADWISNFVLNNL